MFTKLFLLVAAYLVIRAISRRRRKLAVTPEQSASVEAWVNDVLAAEFARRLMLDKAETLRSLRGEPDPYVVSAVTAAVGRIEQRFARMPTGTEVELRLEATFARSAPWSASRLFAWSDLPASVRDEFVRAGGAMVFVPWRLPWQR